jgi:hypothetical protein
LVFCILWFCQDLVFYGQVPFYRDLTNYFYPLRYSLYESFRAGELPLWDRHFAQGFPNLASFQSGAFYVPHLVFFFFPFFASIRALFVLHFLIAAGGTYALLRWWNYPRDLSLVGSLLFALGGVIVSLTNLLNHFQTAVWLPWVILAWERLLLTPRWHHFIAFTFLMALQLLAGSPEIFAMSMALVLLDGFRLRAAEPTVSTGKIIGLAIAGNFLMLALIMVQFLPTAELMMTSRRGHSIPAAEAFMWSFHPASLMNLFFFDKEVESRITSGFRLFFSRQVPFLASSYLGLISMFGMALWTYYATRREKLFVTALALGSFALALGGHSLIYPFLFQHVPFASAIRFPEKFFFLTYILIIFTTMGGLKAFWLDRVKSARGPTMVLGGICLVWLGLYAIFKLRSDMLADFIGRHSSIVPLSDAHAEATVTVLANLQRQVLLAIAFLSVFILFRTDKIRPRVFSVLIVSIVFVDLAWAHRSFLFPLHPDRVYQSSPVIKPAQTGLTRFFYYPSARDLHPAFFSVLGQPTFEQSVALSFQNYLPNVGVIHGVDYFQEIDALNRRSYSDFLLLANSLDFERQIKLLRTFNVGYLVSFRKLSEEGIHQIGHFPNYFSWLYRIEGAIPRAYIVNRSVVEKEPFKTLQRLSGAEFDPLAEVVLEEDVQIRPTRRLQAHVQIQRYGNSSVLMHADTNEEGILVLADSLYPGWKAYVNGEQTRILRANYFYRAVLLPKGKQRIEFQYDPLSFKIGLVISMITLIFIVGVSIRIALRRRASSAPLANPVSIPQSTWT